MTTGRINQVTIVNPSAEANGRTPRRRPWCTRWKGEAEATPAASITSVRDTWATSDRFNCPHWVPQVAVRNGWHSVITPRTTPSHTPLRRRGPEPSQRASADTWRSHPRRSGETFGKASDPQTPNGAR